MITVPVETAGGSYEVHVGAGLLERAGDLLPELPGAERAFVVGDAGVAGRYLDRLSLGLPALHLAIPAGEEAKSLRTAEALYEHLAIQEAHRDDVVVALGGGAAGDTAGFVAATYMRGLPFVQVPTTLTAQVDAAVGGKVGLNLPRGKNLVGSFHQPIAVVADVSTLATLPEDAFRSGLAEVAKYGFAVDPSILDLLEGSIDLVIAREPAFLEDLVARCVRAKAEVVAGDERDTGRRAILNYGHTLGHALERIEAFGGVSHGEAVASGMVFAARLSEALGVGPEGLTARHTRVLAALGLPHAVPRMDPEPLIESMRLDKKYRRGMRFVLLEAIGEPRVVEGVSEEQVRSAIREAAA